MLIHGGRSQRCISSLNVLRPLCPDALPYCEEDMYLVQKRRFKSAVSLGTNFRFQAISATRDMHVTFSTAKDGSCSTSLHAKETTGAYGGVTVLLLVTL